MDTVPLTFTSKEVAALLRVDIRTVHRWMDAQKLPSFRVGATRRCTKEALEKLVGTTIEIQHLSAPNRRSRSPRAPLTAEAREKMSLAAKARHAWEKAQVQGEKDGEGDDQ
jgi:excisionase family DNA binding protein